MRTIPFPAYLIDDADIAVYIKAAQCVATELAGEAETPELATLINCLRDEQIRRGTPDDYSL